MKFKFLLLFFYFKNCYCCCKNSCCDSNRQDNNKINNENNKDRESCKYYLDSGYNINLPLNAEWANCNCAILAVIRLLLSHKFFLDKILNKEISDYAKKAPNNESDYQSLDKNSDLFKEILKCKKNYNAEMDEILHIYSSRKDNPYSILMKFIFLYFQEYFEIARPSKIGYMKPTIDLYGNIREQYDTNKYWAILNQGKKNINKIKLEEFIEKKQENNSIKRYELIGIIGICGKINLGETTLSGTDFVSILPVYDKSDNSKKKVGYVKYQFNRMSEIKDLEYWNNADNYDGWKNPRFFLMIYTNK